MSADSIPETFETKNLHALTLLLFLFKRVSGDEVTDYEEFSREVRVRWAYWREQEGWCLPSQLPEGHYELHLRKDVLGVRFFQGEDVIATMRFTLNGDVGLLASNIELKDYPDAPLIAARILQVMSDTAILRPLEWSLTRGLQRRLPSNGMIEARP